MQSNPSGDGAFRRTTLSVYQDAGGQLNAIHTPPAWVRIPGSRHQWVVRRKQNGFWVS